MQLSHWNKNLWYSLSSPSNFFIYNLFRNTSNISIRRNLFSNKSVYCFNGIGINCNALINIEVISYSHIVSYIDGLCGICFLPHLWASMMLWASDVEILILLLDIQLSPIFKRLPFSAMTNSASSIVVPLPMVKLHPLSSRHILRFKNSFPPQ